jgi:O-acetylhomoserine/O-acetylserine sulfhydrylase-like pyridoxal-dependent enzyme
MSSIGPTLDPHAAFLIQRGMRTYFLRYERQCANALIVSRFLSSHPRVKRVFYPGLETHPQHELAKRQAKDFGAIVSFELNGGLEPAGRSRGISALLRHLGERGFLRVAGDAAATARGLGIQRHAARGSVAIPGHRATLDRARGR